MRTSTPMAAMDGLLAELGPSRVVLQGDAGYDAARAAWNVAADLRPAAVIRARATADVVAAVRWSRRHGVPLLPLSTGHGAATAPALEGAVLLRLDALDAVRVDPWARTVTVGPGATWRAAVEAAEPFGLAPLAGSGPSVGVIGSTLGGGIGWLGRRHGLASESLQTADVVLPDGRLITVDGRREHELLWALRGGRSALGVVVRATLRLHPVAGLAAGALLWPIGRARTVLGAWARWTATAPEATTSMGRILRMPPTPDVPAPLRGRGLVAVELAHAGPDRELAELLAPLRALAPEIDTVGPARPTDLLELARDPETPTPAVADHLLLRELPDLAVESLVDAAGADGHAAPAFAAIRHLGGALARPGAGALGSIPAPYVLVALAVPAGPVTREAAARDVAGVIDAMSPWAHHRTYLNFAERPTSAAAAFGHAAGALAELKRRLDPERLLLGDLAGEPRPH